MGEIDEKATLPGLAQTRITSWMMDGGCQVLLPTTIRTRKGCVPYIVIMAQRNHTSSPRTSLSWIDPFRSIPERCWKVPTQAPCIKAWAKWGISTFPLDTIQFPHAHSELLLNARLLGAFGYRQGHWTDPVPKLFQSLANHSRYELAEEVQETAGRPHLIQRGRVGPLPAAVELLACLLLGFHDLFPSPRPPFSSSFFCIECHR